MLQQHFATRPELSVSSVPFPWQEGISIVCIPHGMQTGASPPAWKARRKVSMMEANTRICRAWDREKTLSTRIYIRAPKSNPHTKVRLGASAAPKTFSRSIEHPQKPLFDVVKSSTAIAVLRAWELCSACQDQLRPLFFTLALYRPAHHQAQIGRCKQSLKVLV